MTDQAESIPQFLLLREYVDNHNLVEGDDLADHLLELNPKNIEAMIEKITLWFTWGTPKLVHEEGVRIHELAPGSAADLFARATTDPDITPVDALNRLDQALELNPIFERAWYARGQILFERKEYTEAIESFDKALKLAPKHSMALFYAGISKNITKDFWGAVINLTDYIRTPDFTDKSWVFAALTNCFHQLDLQECENFESRIPRKPV